MTRRKSQEEASALLAAAGAEPLEPYQTGHTPWRSRCLNCGREIAPRLSALKRQGACPYCARNKIDPQEAAEAMRAAGLEPLEPYQGTHHKWLCLCSGCGQEIRQTLSRIRAGKGCKACGIMRRAAPLRLDASEALSRAQAVGLEPQEPYPGRASERWHCTCMDCGRSVFPSLANMSAGHGCYYCNRHGGGFAQDRAAIIYVAEHDELRAIKVGVAGVESDRVRHLTSLGWRIAYRLRCDNGSTALDLERQVLNHVRNSLGSGPYLTSEQMPRGGHTETIDPEVVTVNDLVERIRLSAGSI